MTKPYLALDVRRVVLGAFFLAIDRHAVHTRIVLEGRKLSCVKEVLHQLVFLGPSVINPPLECFLVVQWDFRDGKASPIKIHHFGRAFTKVRRPESEI